MKRTLAASLLISGEVVAGLASKLGEGSPGGNEITCSSSNGGILVGPEAVDGVASSGAIIFTSWDSEGMGILCWIGFMDEDT